LYLCSEENLAEAGVLYVNELTTDQTGEYFVEWYVGAVEVGFSTFRIEAPPPPPPPPAPPAPLPPTIAPTTAPACTKAKARVKTLKARLRHASKPKAKAKLRHKLKVARSNVLKFC
jgi:hypothetical protein